MAPLRMLRGLGVIVLGSVVAACGSFPPPSAPIVQAKTPVGCEAVSADELLVGNWLNKRQEKGVVGELRTLFTLQADGRMLYTEQLKRPRQPSQGLSESGCWWRDGNKLVLQTLESNGVAVDNDDPIYINSYDIQRLNQDKLSLRDGQGQRINTERTSPGYRLPF